MNETVYVIFILSLVFGAIHGLCGGSFNIQPSKNLFSFIFGE